MTQTSTNQGDSQPQRITVAIDVPLRRLFDYRLPAGWACPAPGVRVRVPFGRRQVVGLVWPADGPPAVADDRLKPIVEVLDDEPLLDADTLELLDFSARYYHHPIGEVVSAALPKTLRAGAPQRERHGGLRATPAGVEALANGAMARAPKQRALLEHLVGRDRVDASLLDEAHPGWRRPAKGLLDKAYVERVEVTAEPHWPAPGTAEPGPALEPAQRSIVDALPDADTFAPILIEGVTGSGKTEVYLAAIQRTIEQGRQALVLVPEIGLTPQLARRFERRLGRPVALLHSDLAEGTRTRNWLAARSGAAPVVLGTRSAVFAPFARLGLIVIDEEHDASLKQQEGFRYHARDLAIWRARQQAVPVLLGSATPSLESLANARRGRFRHARMPQRAGGAAAPAIRVVDLNRHPAEDGLSQPVRDAIATHLARGHQALVFINRRGFAPTLICSDCATLAECAHCDARLTLHLGRNRVQCHHCGATRDVPRECADCGAPLRALGAGTERVEQALVAAFPGVGLTRIDSDTTQARGAREALLQSARRGEAQLLVGTQMLTKGHHLPQLTLVVIANADGGFFASDFRAAERLAQMMLQVAGRAGRAEHAGEVLIQSAFAQHPLLRTLVEQGYPAFADSALEERRVAGWPPFSHVAIVHAASAHADEARQFLATVRALDAERGVDVLGPAPAPMQRRAGLHRFQLLLRSDERAPLQQLLRRIVSRIEALPAPRRLRWSLDVDPQGDV